MNLKKILLLASVFTFFQQLFGQTPQETDVLAANLNTISSFEEGKKQAEKVISYLLENKIIPGASISVTQKGHTIWEQGYGWADIKQRTPIFPEKTLFRVASVSKPISAVSLAKMHEQGIINWNNSLYNYVADFPKKPFDFTIKQLAGHLAGIRGYKGKEVFSNRFLSISEGIEMFANDPLLFAPNTKYHYNSFDWNLVSLAMQNAANIPFETYIKQQVFLPLGMENTLPDMGGLLPNQAVPYTKGKQDFYPSTPVNNFYKLAGGGFLSTSHDVARLGNAVLSWQFLSPEIQSEMLQSQCLDTGEETGYSIGWQSTTDWNGRLYYGHVGNGIGGYAWFYIYPESQVVIVMCFNVTNPSMNPYLQRIIDCVLQGVKYNAIEHSAFPTKEDFEKNRKEIAENQ